MFVAPMYPSSVLDSTQSSLTFEHPVWTETDIFSKELTDSILTENFETATYNHVSSEFLFDIENITSSNNDTTISDTFDFTTNTENDNHFVSNSGSDQFILHSESENGSQVTVSSASNNSSSGEVQINGINSLESIPDALCTFDAFLELDLLNECFNIDESEINTKNICSASEETQNEFVDISKLGMYNATTSNNNVTNNFWPTIDYANAKRRSLLYDKNEYVKLSSNSLSNNRLSRSKTRGRTCSSPISTSVQADHQNEEQRTYRCPVLSCGKTYLKASHLRSHVRRHTGVKPFACDWSGCEWRFSRSDELARHKRSHSGIKPYACDMCEKAFSRSDHLSKHAKVHMKKMAMYGTPLITKKCNYKYLSNKLHVN